MKFNYPPLRTFAFAAAFTGSLIFAKADHGDDDGEQGGDISGSESVHQRAAFTETADSPIGSGGKAELEAEMKMALIRRC